MSIRASAAFQTARIETTAASPGAPRLRSHRPSEDLPLTISCVICAYNEADKILEVLRVVRSLSIVSEVIVVNDGSTDDTGTLISAFPDVRIISYQPNRGKSYAMSRGIAAATGDYVMLLDADLSGITAADIQALVDPVAQRRAEVSISLRRNSLAIYRLIGLDFVSGERLIPAWLIRPSLSDMAALPCWGAEAFINSLITREKLSIAVVEWRDVFNVPKARKLGLWHGLIAEFTMTAQVLWMLSPWQVVQQNLAMLKLITKDSGRQTQSASFRATPRQPMGAEALLPHP